MKLTIQELSALVRNCEANEYLRDRIGSCLCRVLYEPNIEYTDEYKPLGEAWFYNKPSEDDIFLALDYMEETEMDCELILNLD